MIRIFKLLFLLVISQVAFAQAPSNYTNINGRYRWIAGMFDSTFHIPKGSTPSLRTGGSTNAGGLFYNTSDSSVYTYTGTQWIKLRGSIIDTTSLSNRINLKLNISDTASMLSPYLRKIDTTNKFVTQVYKKATTDSVFYVKGGNHIFAFVDSVGSGGGGGGGGGKIYYLNGGVSMGTFGGFTMYELGDTANTGAAANFTRATTGNIANFITDPNKPGLLQIPAGVWSVDAYLSETGGGANHAEIYVAVEKWNGSTITTIATSPIEQITNGNVIDLYNWSVTIPTTTLAVTDRIIIQFYIQNTNGKTVTLYTQNGYVGEVHTTFTTGIGAINGLTAPAQYLVTGTSGTDFNISSATATHTFNLPTASATNRGALSSADWTTFNNKGSVSSVATNTGTGITGGTITTSGTLAIDTLLISTRAWRQKGIDSVASLVTSGYVPSSRTLTINGTTQDLSANRTFSVGTVTSVGITAGTGISVANSPITGSGNITVTNTAPDQTVALTGGTGISISGTYPNFTITNSSPSSGGTVTQVNSGTGLNGGPITTSGTLSVDTLLISTRAWRQKGIDSVQANINGKVNISDTASMLTPYLRKVDTTSMLSPYLRSNVAAATYVPQSRTLTINDQSYDLSDNRSWTITGGIGGSGTTNYIPKWTSSSALGNSDLRTDASNNLGLGVTPSAWGSGFEAFEFNTLGTLAASGSTVFLQSNSYNNGTNNIRKAIGEASSYSQSGGAHIWQTAAFGSSGSTISFSEQMRITSGGDLLIGTTTASGKLTINGVTSGASIKTDNSSSYSFIYSTISGSNGITFDNVSGALGAYVGGAYRMYINTSGNIGIGTTSPNAKLSLGTSVSTDKLFLYDDAGTYPAGDKYGFGIAVGQLQIYSPSTTSNIALGQRNSTTGVFSESMRITSGGATLIGTTSTPSSANIRLAVIGTTGNEGYIQIGNPGGGGAAIGSQLNGGLDIYTYSGVVGSETYTRRMFINSSGLVGIGTTTLAANLSLSGSGDIGMRIKAGSTNLSYIDFDEADSGTPNGSIAYNHASNAMTFATGGSNAERMRITSGGIVLVGKTSASVDVAGFRIDGDGSTYASIINATEALYVRDVTNAAYRFYVSGAGTVYATSTTISAISDIRYKENVRDLDGALNKLMLLKPRIFDWKEGMGKNIKNDKGFIAQEFEQIFPELVDKWKEQAPQGQEPYKSIRQDLIPYLVKAIQEQQAQIEQLKTSIETLKNK